MRSLFRLALLLYAFIVVLIAGVAQAKDVYLTIAGSPGVFHTDTRIFNPSSSKDIVVTATFLRARQDNSSAPSKQITIPRRQMVAYDDVLRSLFDINDPNVIGGVKLTSSDDFVATQRIYALIDSGTVGQFVAGLEPSAAKTKGVLIQLKATAGMFGPPGTFRTNLGFMNPNSSAATVTVVFYDKNSAVVGQTMTRDVLPLSVDFPIIIPPEFGNLSDAWVWYSSTQPVFGFASVVDSGTIDAEYIAAFEDTAAAEPPPPPAQLTVVVGPGFTFTPSTLRIQAGDTVTWEFRSEHTTTSDLQTGPEVWDSGVKSSGTFSRTFLTPGNHKYYCRLHSVAGGTGMNGVIVVQEPYQPPGY